MGSVFRDMNSSNYFRFGLGHLFVILSVASICLAWTYEESLNVALGTLFAGASYCVVAVLLSISAADMLGRMPACWDAKSLRPLLGRYRWVIMDTVSITLAICAIAVTNFVRETSAFHAPKLLILAGFGSLVLAVFTFWRFMVPSA